MDNIVQFLQANYLNIIAVLWSIDQLLKVVAPLTPWKVDDNVADILGKLLARFGGKKPE